MALIITIKITEAISGQAPTDGLAKNRPQLAQKIHIY